MRLRDPFGMALNTLRTALSRGAPPGHRLPIADLAMDLRLSTSPVREALSRLCGEGLIEDRRGLGYFTRTLPAEDIIGLLELERAHVELAVDLSGEPRPVGIIDDSFEVWISSVAERCASEPIKESLDRVSARLASIRPLFPRSVQQLRHGPADAISDYYGDRIRLAPTVASRVRRLDTGGAESIVKTV